MLKKIEIDLSGITSERELIDRFYEVLQIAAPVNDNWDAFYDNLRDVNRLSGLAEIKEADELVIDVSGCGDLPINDFIILKDLLISATDDTQRNDSIRIYVRLTR